MTNLRFGVLICGLVFARPTWVRAQDTFIQPAEGARQRSATEQGPPPEAAPAPAPESQHPVEASVGTTDQAVVIGVPSASSAPMRPPAAQLRAAAPRLSAETREPSYAAQAIVPPPKDGLREDERIGSYGQPRWSATRRFPGTRMYVVPAGTVGIEWWLEDKQSLDRLRDVRYRSQYEIEMGLGHRLQLDLYLQTEQNGHHGPLQIGAEKAELRYALADWGVIPLNPTVYVEFVRQNAGPPKVELKALFGEQIAPRWHMGFNLVWEHELGERPENEYALTTGVSYTLADERFALGAEVVLESVDHSGDRLSFRDWELLAGPSLAWSPVPPMHLLLAALFGNEKASGTNTALFEPTLVLGWEL